MMDPAPEAYSKALSGKRVLMVPMAMGFDLAQGWAAILQREVSAFGGTFETRDPNWSVEAGAQALTEAIASDPKPDVLVVMSPDLNSYSKIMKKAQEAGIYVLLIDNPANFKADAYLGGDWTQLGRLEAEAAVKACGDGSSKKIGLVQGDETNATSLFQYDGIMDVLSKHPDFEVVAKPDSNWDRDDLAQRDDDHASAASGRLRHHRFLGRRRDGRGGRDPRRRPAGQGLPGHHRRRRKDRRLREDRATEPMAPWSRPSW